MNSATVHKGITAEMVGLPETTAWKPPAGLGIGKIVMLCPEPEPLRDLTNREVTDLLKKGLRGRVNDRVLLVANHDRGQYDFDEATSEAIAISKAITNKFKEVNGLK